MLKINTNQDSFEVLFDGMTVFTHSVNKPAVFVGNGHEKMEMYRGNFNIEDYLETRIPLTVFAISLKTHSLKTHSLKDQNSNTTNKSPQLTNECIELEADTIEVSLFQNKQQLIDNYPILTFQFSFSDVKNLEMKIIDCTEKFNRLWIRTPAESSEPVWGCGEQMSYFNLRGRHFPLWTSEPGVGRDKSTYITWRSDVENKAGGDYYHTNYPQPTFVSLVPSTGDVYALHANTTAYADFDFRQNEFHELQFWAIPESFVWFKKSTLTDLIGVLSTYFGRQPKLPEWIISGAILGLKRGQSHAQERLNDALAKGVKVSGVWCEDWSGIRETSFGVRLFWDWQWNKSRYPDLKNWISNLNQQGIHFLGYTNPYLCIDGPLYQEAKVLGYMATQEDGSDYAVDFGEFYCAVVDFTIPAAQAWFSERIIQQEMLELGINGWMADFGEYLPIDLKLADKSCPKQRHNEWPVLWSKVNADAIAAKGKTGDAVFFMRAGYSGVQRYCSLLWGGDQSVDFSRYDGLVTVIPAALSSGILGNAYHHSDIGGYTSLFGNVRTPELFMRWTEMCAFTPVMRTHEGNRPTENFQFWQDEEVYEHFAKTTQWHNALVPYVKSLIEEASNLGLPLQRAMVIHHQDDPRCYDIFDQYLYGRALLIAPVYHSDTKLRNVYLPKGCNWIHIWSDKEFVGGSDVSVDSPIGKPAVFIRSDQRNNLLLVTFFKVIK